MPSAVTAHFAEDHSAAFTPWTMQNRINAKTAMAKTEYRSILSWDCCISPEKNVIAIQQSTKTASGNPRIATSKVGSCFFGTHLYLYFSFSLPFGLPHKRQFLIKPKKEEIGCRLSASAASSYRQFEARMEWCDKRTRLAMPAFSSFNRMVILFPSEKVTHICSCIVRE